MKFEDRVTKTYVEVRVLSTRVQVWNSRTRAEVRNTSYNSVAMGIVENGSVLIDFGWGIRYFLETFLSHEGDLFIDFGEGIFLPEWQVKELQEKAMKTLAFNYRTFFKI